MLVLPPLTTEEEKENVYRNVRIYILINHKLKFCGRGLDLT